MSLVLLAHSLLSKFLQFVIGKGRLEPRPMKFLILHLKANLNIIQKNKKLRLRVDNDNAMDFQVEKAEATGQPRLEL